MEHRSKSTTCGTTSRALAGLCFGAAKRGASDRIRILEMDDLLNESIFEYEKPHGLHIIEAWEQARLIARETGIMFLSDDRSEYIFTHKVFADFFAGLHLAKHLRSAAEQDFFELVLLKYAEDRSFDPILMHTLSFLSTDTKGRELVTRAFQFLNTMDKGDALSLITNVSGDVVYDLVAPVIRDSKSTTCVPTEDKFLLHPRAWRALACARTPKATDFVKQVAQAPGIAPLDRLEATICLAELDPPVAAMTMGDLCHQLLEDIDGRIDDLSFSAAYELIGKLYFMDPAIALPILSPLCRDGKISGVIQCLVLRHFYKNDYPGLINLLNAVVGNSNQDMIARIGALDLLAEVTSALDVELFQSLLQEPATTDSNRLDLVLVPKQACLGCI